MQIVIDTHEKDYQSLLNGNITFSLLDAIRNGRPLPTAKWIKYQEPWGGMQGYKCSNCKNHYDVSSVYTIIPYNYCPNCGSAMTEE